MTAALAIQDVSLASIRPSQSNPRRTFLGIDELAASIKSRGVIAPITVRPIERGTVPYELVVGERRWRAAKKAGLSALPAIVRTLSDQEVLEIQLIENAQREDVHPLEEADGYEALISKHGYTPEQVATKVGKSLSTIRARLRLGSLVDYPREAFLEGRLNASLALMIARIADASLQEQATKDVLGETALEHVQFKGIPGETPEQLADLTDPDSPLAVARRTQTTTDDDGEQTHEPIPMSVREAQLHLQRRYMLRLALAKFDTGDQSLLPAAGSCSACEFRTGNQRELFEDVTSADVCTKPSCFEQKTRAAWEVKAAAAAAAGVKVLAAEATDKVFTPTAQIRATSPFVDPKSPVPMDLLPAGTKKAPTWEKLLGRKLGSDDAPFVLAQDAAGAAHELLDKKKAVEALRDAGKIDKPLKPASSSSSSSRDPMKDDREKELKKREQWTRAARAAVDEAWKKSEDLDLKDPEWWKWAIKCIAAVTNAHDLPGDVGHVEDLMKAAKSIEDYMQIVTVMLVADVVQLPINRDSYLWSDPGKDKDTLAAFALLGIRYSEHLERIKESDKVAAKVEAQLAKKGLKQCILLSAPHAEGGKRCILADGHEGAHFDGEKNWNDPALPKGMATGGKTKPAKKGKAKS